MRVATIVAMLGELLETHMSKCDSAEQPMPHIVSETEHSQTTIRSIRNTETMLFLDLDDGTRFNIVVVET